jgi:hypothetical protein
MVQAGIQPTSTLPNWTMIFINMILVIGCCLLMAWLMGQRRGFALRPRSAQRMIGAACLASPVVVLLLFDVLSRVL